MDLASFQYFLSIAEHMSFSEAAEENHVSQSSLSKAILRLEQELNVKLFDRNHHPINLTNAGCCLRDFLLEVKPLYKKTLRELDQYRIHHTIRCYLVPRLYALKNASLAFLASNRDIELTLSTGSNFATAIHEMMDGDFDIGVMHQPFELPEGLRMTVLYNDQPYVVLPRNHPLAEKSILSLHELDGYTFEESYFSSTLVHELSDRFGFKPERITVHQSVAGSREESLVRISHGDRIGIFCGRDITMYNIQSINLVARPLKEVPALPLVLVERPEHTDTEWHQRFCAFLKEKQESYAAPILNLEAQE